MPAKASSKRASTTIAKGVKRRKTSTSNAVAPPKKSWADLPMELKLLIFSFLEEGQRIITFKAKYSSTAAPILFLAKPLKPPLLLSICHKTRAKALKRYSSSLSELYEDFRIDFERDIFEVIPVVRNPGSVPKEGGLEAVDRDKVMNFSIRVGYNDRTPYVLRYLIPMVDVFPNSKYVFQNKPLERRCSRSREDRLRDAYEAKRRKYPDCGRPIAFTCRRHFSKACPRRAPKKQ